MCARMTLNTLAIRQIIRHSIEMKNKKVRNLDHVVLATPDLEIARERLTALGFTVAPDAQHSFGSENACVFFENGTFIEPLSIGQRETVEDAIQKGNNFLRRDAAFRFRQGENGFSMVVLGEPDPRSARKLLKKAGYETGKIVVVKRPGVKVHIALAIDARSPDLTMFLCERPDGPPSFPKDLTEHKNGALGISAVYLHEQLPEDFQYYLQTVTGQREVRSHSFGMEMKLPNATISSLNSDGMKNYFGVDELPTIRGMRAMAFDVKVKELSKLTKHLEKQEIDYKNISGRVIVDPADGQGAIISFREG